MTFPKKLLKELDLPWSALEDRIIDNSRWSIIHEIIFEYEGKHYQTLYSIGATEQQDESPWQYQPEEVECREVHQVPVTELKWVPVNG